MTQKLFSARLPEALYAKLKDKAYTDGVSFSSVITDVLTVALDAIGAEASQREDYETLIELTAELRTMMIRCIRTTSLKANQSSLLPLERRIEALEARLSSLD